MKSTIKTIRYENGDIQRVQAVKFSSFSNLKFVRPQYNRASYTYLCKLFNDYIIKKFEKVLGKIIIFTISENEEIPFDMTIEDTHFYDSLSRLTLAFRNSIKTKNKKLVFSDSLVEDYFHRLKEKGDLVIVEGNLDRVSFLPVGRTLGYLSECSKTSQLSFNSSFFVMDQFDCSTIFDRSGVPIGLAVQDGKIINPPQFSREALVVLKDKSVSIKKVELSDLAVVIDNISYKHKENAIFYERPSRKKTPKGKTDIIVVNNKVVAINAKGNSSIPSGGFVIQVKDRVPIIKNVEVSYKGLEDVLFAIQVGNSAIVNGIPTKRFLSPFYKFWHIGAISFPPCMYPLSYKKDRAPRMLLGSDENNKPIVLWLEGSGKFGYIQGKESCGASLSESSKIAKDFGLYNAIHLDGGGSAQILINGKRELLVSDRDKDDYSEIERAIALALQWRKN